MLPVKTSAGVKEWLSKGDEDGDDDNASVLSWERGFGGAPMSDYGGDDVVGIMERLNESVSGPEVPSEDDVRVAEVALMSQAQRQQRMVAATQRRLYVRGRMHIDYGDVARGSVRQRLMTVPGYMQVGDLTDSALYERLSAGRVYTRLGMPTGIGKTTKLPAMIAQRCNLRVCLVTVDANLAKRALKRMKMMTGVKGSNRVWTRKQEPFVGAMSYHDFCGIAMSGGMTRFFKDFDVFIFDEPHLKTAEVYAAKQMFCCFAQDCSLLLLSATVSSNAANDMAAKSVGKFLVEPVLGGFSALIDSGKLLSQYLVDRTMVLRSSARAVYETQVYYEEAGCDVKILDEGSSERDNELVDLWLSEPDSVCPRILVCTESYGTAYDFPISYVITDCERTVFVSDGEGGLVEKVVPVEASDRSQHAGRSGRGRVSGSGGIFCRTEVAEVQGELMRCDAMKAYIYLVAAGITPRPGLCEEASSVFPSGLSRDVAKMILSIALPVGLVIRYLGSDGRIAHRFCRGMSLFRQRDHVLEPSRDVDPVGYASWKEESLGAYWDGEREYDQVKVMVPFSSPSSLKIVMHTLCAVSKGWLDVPTWYPDFSDDSESEDESLGGRGKSKPKTRKVELRLVVDEEKKEQPVVKEATPSWMFDVPPASTGRGARRSAVKWSQEGRAVVAELVSRADTGASLDVSMSNVERKEVDGKRIIELKRPTVVEVESPGGSPVFTLSALLYDRLISGEILTGGMFVEMLDLVKSMRDRFVYSTLFDVWGQPWLSLLGTCAAEEPLRYAIRAGYSSTVAKFVDVLYRRFRSETLVVCSESNVYRGKVKKLWTRKGLSVTRLADAIRKGKIPVAQSDAFLKRFSDIHVAYTRAVSVMENCGVFTPSLVTAVQEPLPLRAQDLGMPVEGGSVVSIRGLQFEKKWDK